MLIDRQLMMAFESFLGDIRKAIEDNAPELLSLFDIYAAEALFGRRYIDSDLRDLPSGAKILEVGAGALLLSCQLAREGFQVSALEPIGDGFSHFDKMRQIVLKEACLKGGLPTVINQYAETLEVNNFFDYAFSVNVMEHVNNVECVLEKVVMSLKAGSKYRFTCANYIFPYEPHFNIPTLFSKSLTEKLFYKKIFNSQKVPDPIGTWSSLNWINVLKVKQSIRRISLAKVIFNNKIFVAAAERVLTDQEFSARRSTFVRNSLLCMVRLRLHYLFGFVPALFLPLMDCTIKKSCSEVN